MVAVWESFLTEKTWKSIVLMTTITLNQGTSFGKYKISYIKCKLITILKFINYGEVTQCLHLDFAGKEKYSLNTEFHHTYLNCFETTLSAPPLFNKKILCKEWNIDVDKCGILGVQCKSTQLKETIPYHLLQQA